MAARAGRLAASGLAGWNAQATGVGPQTQRGWMGVGLHVHCCLAGSRTSRGRTTSRMLEGDGDRPVSGCLKRYQGPYRALQTMDAVDHRQTTNRGGTRAWTARGQKRLLDRAASAVTQLRRDLFESVRAPA